MIKLIVDGALFSENEMLGTNKNGMIRIAEELTREFMSVNKYDIHFINTIYSKKYDVCLKRYIEKRYPAYRGRILSKTPVLSSALPGLNRMSKYAAQLFSFQVTTYGLKKGDIYHSFYYPFSNNIASNTDIKKCITFLDIIPLRMKGYSKSLIDMTKRVVQSIVSNYAIAISEYSKQDLLEYNKAISADRVFVAPLAASKDLFFHNRNREDWMRVQRKYRLPDKYFLCISSTDARKNLHHILKCFNLFMLQERPPDLHLVMTGNTTYGREILDTLNIDKTVRERIVITERYIDNEDLSAVYSNALCFFFMSLYEGFGLPVLEAMQCGVPVVTSNITSIPEITGNAAILIDPNDELELCNTMVEVYANESLRTQYGALGMARAQKYSWKKCAEDYSTIFQKIALS